MKVGHEAHITEGNFIDQNFGPWMLVSKSKQGPKPNNFKGLGLDNDGTSLNRFGALNSFGPEEGDKVPLSVELAKPIKPKSVAMT